MFESLLLVLALIIAPADDCFDDTFCVDVLQRGDSVELVLRSLVPGHISLRLEVELDNMKADGPLPVFATLPGWGRLSAVSLTVVEPGQAWSYRYGVQWTPGTLNAEHDDGYVYRLPYDDGSSYLVGQGYNGPMSHQGINAIDFDLPEGTWVIAARDGVVVETEQRFREGGKDPDLKTRSNFVRVQHSDGTVGDYVHLQPAGVHVEVGQPVRRGDRLGRSGHTGYASGPHLHFEVYGISSRLERMTFPVRFETSDGPQLLQVGRRYRP